MAKLLSIFFLTLTGFLLIHGDDWKPEINHLFNIISKAIKTRFALCKLDIGKMEVSRIFPFEKRQSSLNVFTRIRRLSYTLIVTLIRSYIS